MKPHTPLPFPHLLLNLILFLILFPSCHCHDSYTLCHRHYVCGNIQGVWYPFWGGTLKHWCGRNEGFKLFCIHHTYAVIDMSQQKQRFRLLAVDQVNFKMRIARWDLWHDVCLQNYTLTNTTLDYNNHYSYGEKVRNLSLFYGCLHDPQRASYSFPCPAYDGFSNYFVNESFRGEMLKMCMANIVVSISQEAEMDLFSGKKKLKEALREGFDVRYLYPDRETCINCSNSGGLCGSNSTNEFICHYFDQENTGTGQGKPAGLLIGICAAAAGLLAFCIIAFSFRHTTRIMPSNKTTPGCLQKTKNDRVEVLIADYESLAQKRYRYSDIKKMTRAFREKLGDGGYGSVYKGSLPCGRAVAVKMLNRTKGKEEEFINEVTTISRTSHVNIVSLLGFCMEGHKRALVFEFMANGSLEKFISDENASNAVHSLGWENLYQIAMGIARGLEYLHRGCTKRILHFDIKPHNILIDEKFSPKISDFGLAKLCTKQESVISMKDARGTIGYIAPEVLSRNFGVSHKSDVYSYGMMVLEMVSGRKNKNVKADHASEIYFPHWVYKRLQLSNDLGLCCDMTKEENETARKLVLLGLWCIQTNPSCRPSMSKVIIMLEGSLEAMKIPPAPFMFSPDNAADDHPASSSRQSQEPQSPASGGS